jgi:hypothetical protein
MPVAADRASRYELVRQIQSSYPDRLLGVLNWAAVSDEFGLYDETTLTLQSDIAPAWASFPGR